MNKKRNRKRKGVTFKCTNCGSDAYKSPFIAKRNTKNNFCSLICKREFSKREITPCSNCGKILHLEPFRVKMSKSGMHFCSHKCKSIKYALIKNPISNITNSPNFKPDGYWLGKKRPPMAEESRRKISISSKGRKPYIVTPEIRIKMSQSHKGKKLSKSTVQKQKIRMTGNKYRLGTIQPLETRIKMSNDRKGNKHWNWKGGKVPLKMIIRHSFQYKNWRTSIFIRDNRTCIWCGSKHKIEADHIKPFSLIREENNIQSLDDAIACKELWDINNGRTLCQECHKKTDTYLSKVNKYLKNKWKRLAVAS